MTTTNAPARLTGLTVTAFPHPQGCRTWLLADPVSGQALAIDVHLDLVDEVAARVKAEGWTLPWVVDTHTHADHPSGSAALAARFSSTRVAHEAGHHVGVSRHPADGETLHLGDRVVTVRHAPGHTPDHVVLLADGHLFAGDTLLIGGVARTDFLGGDAGRLHDSLHRILADLPDETVLHPGHDYQGRTISDLRTERRANPWLGMERDEFVRQLTANPPPRPANMDDLLHLNREGVDIPASIPAAEAKRLVDAGGVGSVIDVRTGAEVAGEHIVGSRPIPLDQLESRVDEVRAVPAPRLLLCRTGSRANMARETLEHLHVAGLTVIEGGIEAWRRAGGATKVGEGHISLERQVRIVAGTLVLLGVALAWLVHPVFLGLVAFVGAGQIFAGATDWCGMGLLLAKAPWNRKEPEFAPPSGACAASAPTPPGACAASAPTAPGACAATPPSKD